MTATTTSRVHKGGSWLLEPTAADRMFTPERFTDEHRLMSRTAHEFVTNEVLAVLDRLEAKDWERIGSS